MKIYYANINDFTIEYLNSIVSDITKEKVNRYRHEADKKRSLLAIALLAYAGRENNWDLTTPVTPVVDEYGKPHIYDRNENEKYFSISHSDDIVVCALSDNYVGVDVEKIGDFKPGIVDRFFSLYERKLVFDGDSFYKIWSLKESYMKVTGLGMSLAMDNFFVKPDQEDDTICTYGIDDRRVSDSEIKKRLKMNAGIIGHSINLCDGYSSAVCGYEWDGSYEIKKVKKI